MNVIDATALPMFDCFAGIPDKSAYSALKNNIPLDEMNKGAAALRGKARKFALLSASPEFDHIDSGNDDLLNRLGFPGGMFDPVGKLGRPPVDLLDDAAA